MAEKISVVDVYSSIDKAFSEVDWLERAINEVNKDNIDLSDIVLSLDELKSALDDIEINLENFHSDLEIKLDNIKEFFKDVLE